MSSRPGPCPVAAARRERSSGSLFALGLAAAAACTPVAPAPVMTRAPVEFASRPADESPAPAVPRAYVWIRGGESEAPVTLALSDRGDTLARLPGIHIAAAGTEWRWEETIEAIPTAPCSADSDGIERPAAEGRGTRVRLVPADSHHDPLALVVPPAADGENEVDHAARLLASIGPYLFIEESMYAYTCGAHGNSDVHFAVWDVEEASTVDLLSELPDQQRLVAEGKTAIDEDPEAVDLSSEQAPPRLTELLPRVGRHGTLEASALVTVPSCYACSSGGWSSYTSSAPVPAQLPGRLQKLGPPPEAVRRFADAHPDVAIAGYSAERP